MRKRASIDLERAREDFTYCPEPLETIAKRHGVARKTLVALAKQGSWRRKVRTVPRRRRSRPELAALAIEKAKRELGSSIIARLYRAVDRKLQEIEKRMSETNGRESRAADVERDARALSALAQLYAKLKELEVEVNKPEEKADSITEEEQDADRLRDELARRLAGLSRSGDMGGVS